MAVERTDYTLQIVFDGQTKTVRELRRFNSAVTNLITPDPPQLVLSVKLDELQNYLVQISGTLLAVDKAHALVDDALIRRGTRKAVVLLDEVADEVRRQAYVIVARIEQRLRRFINGALIEVWGFDWWEKRAPAKLKKEVDDLRKKKPGESAYYAILPPLESLQFDDLIGLVTTETSAWTEGAIITTTELAALLQEAQSFEDLQQTIRQRLTKVSLWDDVFVLYFKDRAKWDSLKKTIEQVIKIRHLVAHHLPMRLALIKRLEDWDAEIESVLKTASPKLGTEARMLAEQSTLRLNKSWEILAQQYVESTFKANSALVQYAVDQLQQQMVLLPKYLQGPDAWAQIMSKLAEPSLINFQMHDQAQASYRAILAQLGKQNLDYVAKLMDQVGTLDILKTNSGSLDDTPDPDDPSDDHESDDDSGDDASGSLVPANK